MATRFYYVNFARNEDTEAYLRAQMQGVVEKFFPDGRFVLHLRVSRMDNKKNNLQCELRLDLPNQSKPVFIKKEGYEFFQTVKELGIAFKTAVERLTDVQSLQLSPVKIKA
jgi:hypothetical protein